MALDTPGHYALQNSAEIPRGYGDVVFDVYNNREKGFRISGGGILKAGSDFETSQSLIATKKASPLEVSRYLSGKLTAFGVTFRGLKFQRQERAHPLVSLPDADTVQFSNCNFKDSFYGNRDQVGDPNVRMYASDNLNIDEWGAWELEIVGCECANTGRDHVKPETTTPNKLAGNMFNPAN